MNDTSTLLGLCAAGDVPDGGVLKVEAGGLTVAVFHLGERYYVTDDATIYAAAGVPLLVWHATLPRKFVWFVSGDFVTEDGLIRHDARKVLAALWPAAGLRQAETAPWANLGGNEHRLPVPLQAVQ